MQIVGIIVEEGRVVVLDAHKKEHRATTADELWALVRNLSQDETLPAIRVTKRPRAELDQEEIDDATERLASMVESAAGAAYGTAAARVAKDHVPKAARGVIGFIQAVSRKGTRPLPLPRRRAKVSG